MVKSRIYYFDYLRIISAFSVVVLHISAYGWSLQDTTTFDWQIINVYRGIVQFGVPVFIMISGALFLEKNISLKKLYGKYIIRIVVALFFWSVLYGLWSNLFIAHNYNIKGLINTILFGHYHLWFLFMLIGLYMMIPFLKRIIEDKRTAWYFVVASFVLVFCIPELIWLVGMKSAEAAELLNKYNALFDIHLVLGYSGYFVLGYLINKTELEKKHRIIIYTLGIIGVVLSVGSTAVLSVLQKNPTGSSYSNTTIETLFASVSIFVFAKTHLNKTISLTKRNALSFLSKCSFGIYLVHPFIIESFERLNFTALSFNSLLSVPVLSIIVFLISLIISMLINKIPILKKWLV